MTSNFALRQVAQVIGNGGVVAYPTESIWGLGCNPFDAAAVESLLWLKQRPIHKGLIVLVDHLPAAIAARLNTAQKKQLCDSWPGPNTWLVPNCDVFSDWITGGSDEVALRHTAHAPAAKLCTAAGGALVSTSANITGSLPCRAQWQVQKHFGSQLSAVLSGPLGNNKQPTTIRRLLTGETLRD